MATVSSMVGRSSMGSGSRGSVKSGKSAPSGIPKGLGAIDEMQEVATGTIAARPAMPARKSKMRNTAPSVGGQSNSEVLDTTVACSDRRCFCENILVDGYVSSFVDFFYLTHRAGPRDDAASLLPEDETGEIFVPPEEMLLIKDQLVAAEEARRKGDTPAVYTACTSLAQYYQSVDDPKTGVYFYEKCLEVSKLTNDLAGEMLANHYLGRAHEGMNNMPKAMQHHERHKDLAKSHTNQEALKVASGELISVYGKCAQAQEDAADFEGAVLFWRSSLDSARVAGDRAAEGQACYRIGKAWTQLGDAMRAITFLEDYESISRELEDLEGQGNAFAALSTAYKSLGNDAKALELLNLHLSTATKTMNLVAQAEACSNLAVLYMRQGQHIKAREMLTRNFSITRQVVSGGSPGMTSASVDKARSLLGIASGNAMLKDYVNAMLCNTKGVLDWKCKRTPLSS